LTFGTSSSGLQIQVNAGQGFSLTPSPGEPFQVPLAVGVNTIAVTLSKADQPAQTYTFTIQRKQSSNANLSELSIDYSGTGGETTPVEISPAFSAANPVYTAVVFNTVSSVTIWPTADDLDKASIIVNGQELVNGAASVQLGNPGSTTAIAIIVTAEDGTTKTYTMNVTRQPYLVQADEVVVDGLQQTAFHPETYTYELSPVENATDELTMKFGMSSSGLQIQVNAGQGISMTPSPGVPFQVPLTVGVNTITVTLSKADQPAQTYTFTIQRKQSSNANLSELSVAYSGAGGETTSVEISPAFNPTNPVYTAVVFNTVSSVTIRPTADDLDKASIIVNGQELVNDAATVQLGNPGSTTEITIIVTAEDGTTKTYTVNITRQPYLVQADEVVVDGMQQTAFHPETYTYELSPVENATDELSLTFGASSSGLQIQVNAGQGFSLMPSPGEPFQVPLAVGVNTIAVTLSKADQPAQTYTFTIQRKQSSNANLAELSVAYSGTGGETTPVAISPAFNPVSPVYTAVVFNTVSSVTIRPTADDLDKASIIVNGQALTNGAATVQLGNPGSTTEIAIVVTAEDGTTKTYTVNITRQPYLVQADEVVVDGLQQTAFHPETYTYELSPVENATDELTMTFGASSSGLQIQVNAGQGFSLTPSPGEPFQVPLAVGVNTITVTLSKADQPAQTYTFTIERKQSSNANLSELSVAYSGAGGETTSVEISPAFNPTNPVYTAVVFNTVSSVTIRPTADDLDKASIIVNGQALTNGAATVQLGNPGSTTEIAIVVTAEDGTTKTYTVNITRQPYLVQADEVVVDGLQQTGFHPETYTYELSPVENATDELTMTFGALSSGLQIQVNAGQGFNLTPSPGEPFQVPLAVGVNTIAVTLSKADQPAQTYTFTIQRTKSSNTNLSKLALSYLLGNYDVTGFLQPTFDPATTAYSVEVDYRVEEVSVEAVAEEATSLIKVNQELLAGSMAMVQLGVPGSTTVIQIEVEAENGSNKTYSIHVNRLPYLLTASEIIVPGLAEVFDPDRFNYALEPVVSDTASLQMSIGTQGNELSIEVSVGLQGESPAPIGSGLAPGVPFEVPLAVGSNMIQVKLSKPGYEQLTYTFNVVRQASTRLAEMEVRYLNQSEEMVYAMTDPEFDPSVTDYWLEVPIEVSELELGLFAEDEENTSLTVKVDQVLLEDGQIYIELGEPGSSTRIVITVTSSSGETAQYEIEVLRSPFLVGAQDVVMDGLEVFNPAVSDYDLGTVPKSTESIQATLGNSSRNLYIEVENMTMEYYDTVESGGQISIPLRGGVNEIRVQFMMNEQYWQTYTFQLVREQSSNANLTSISLSYLDMEDNLVEASTDPSFDPSTLLYTVEVPVHVSQLNIAPIAEDSEDAIVRVDDDWLWQAGEQSSVSLTAPGGVKTVHVKVMAEDGSVSDYVLNIKRAVSLVTQEDVSVDELTDFDPAIFEYSLGVPSSTDSIGMTFGQESSIYQVIAFHAERQQYVQAQPGQPFEVDLVGGTNTVVVTVQFGQAYWFQYTFYIEKELSSEAAITLFFIDVPQFGRVEGTIDEANKTILLAVPSWFQLPSIIPGITFAGVSIEQNVSDEMEQTYTVVAEDGTKALYRVVLVNPGVNIAPNAEVSANYSFDAAGDYPSNVVNGEFNYGNNPHDRWTNYGGPDNSWLQLDFGTLKALDRIDLYLFNEGEGGGVQPPDRYVVEYTIDNKNWFVATHLVYTPDPSPVAVNGDVISGAATKEDTLNSLIFDPVIARKFRVVFIQGNANVGVVELEAFYGEFPLY